jgi:hypothetical protein
MALNGPQQRSKKWRIQVIQIFDEVTPGITDDYSNAANAFRQAMARAFGFSPTETGPRMKLKKHIKIE